jgi:hypothetical protein
MHPKVADAIQQIDAAVFNGDTFEEPEARAELVEYLKRWCKHLSEPYYGTEPPVFAEEWAKMKAQGYQYGADALENVAFGFNIAKAAYERGYVEEVISEQCSDCGEVINGAHGHCPAADGDGNAEE